MTMNKVVSYATGRKEYKDRWHERLWKDGDRIAQRIMWYKLRGYWHIGQFRKRREDSFWAGTCLRLACSYWWLNKMSPLCRICFFHFISSVLKINHYQKYVTFNLNVMSNLRCKSLFYLLLFAYSQGSWLSDCQPVIRLKILPSAMVCCVIWLSTDVLVEPAALSSWKKRKPQGRMRVTL
jgi:hypothetical protein